MSPTLQDLRRFAKQIRPVSKFTTAGFTLPVLHASPPP